MFSRHFLLASASLAIAYPALAADGLDASLSEDDAAVQEGTTDTGSPRTRRVFKPEDFKRFAPRSALDMAKQIPGFSIRSDNSERGLGQADTNVIINGQRISGKANGPVEALQRIPSDEVVRLELVDGASLDIGGLTGQVLNVITKSTGSMTGQYRWSAEWRSFGVPFRWGDGQISLAGGNDRTEWTLSFENDASRRGNEGIEFVFDADGELIDTRDEKANYNNDRPSLSGSFSRKADNGNILNLNGQVGASIFRQTETSLRSGIVSPVDRFRLFESSEDEFNFELGGDYGFDLGAGRLKLIAYHRYEDSPTVAIVTTEYADGRALEGSRFTRDADEGETIARAEYTFSEFGGDLQLAAEGVKNYLEIEGTLETRDADGNYQPVAFEGSSSRVDEDRAEASLTYSRALASNLQMQLSLGGEYSKISQSGTQGQTRTFWRPKGFAALDWKANPTFNLSGRVERKVGQLNFFDFIASTNLDQDRVNVTNAELVPPQSWLFEAEATRSFGALGSFNLRAFHEAFTDVVDQIPIEGGGEAPGNIPSATVSGVSGELTVLFDPIGIKGLRLDAKAALAQSDVLDPLLGTSRDISNFEIANVEVAVRKDVIGTPWALGGSYQYEERRADVRLSEISLRTETPGNLRLFIEHKNVLGMTARFRVGNLADQQDNFERVIYVDRLAGIVDVTEQRRRRFGTVYSFDIEGSF